MGKLVEFKKLVTKILINYKKNYSFFWIVIISIMEIKNIGNVKFFP